MAKVHVDKVTQVTVKGASLELTENEFLGLTKLIGSTSINSRQDKHGLTENQSRAMATLYSQLTDALGKVI